MADNQPYHDHDLLIRIADGDAEAFTLLYQQYFGELQPYLWKFTGNKEETEEIIQETFIRVWLYRDRLHEIKNLRAWIYKVAAREALTYLRKKLKLRERVSFLQPDAVQAVDSISPDQITQAAQIQRLIQKVISEMPEQRRKIFQMRRNDGLEVSEIAERLGISVSTVKNTIIEAQKQIRRYLESAGYTFPLFIYLVLGFF